MASTQRRLSKKQQRKANQNQNRQQMLMREIEPMTDTQETLFDLYDEDNNVAAIGSAGTGKTMCALYLALSDVLELPEYDKVIIIRSAVQTREQGFMPGSKAQKEAVFTAPYIDIVNNLFGRGDAWEVLKSKQLIEFMTSSFVRGLTFDNAIIVVDECQSMTYHELDSIITRVGESSKIIFCGDTAQDDLATSRNRAEFSGLVDFIKVLRKIPSFKVVNFKTADIVRSGLVKEYIIAKENESRNLRLVEPVRM